MSRRSALLPLPIVRRTTRCSSCSRDPSLKFPSGQSQAPQVLRQDLPSARERSHIVLGRAVLRLSRKSCTMITVAWSLDRPRAPTLRLSAGRTYGNDRSNNPSPRNGNLYFSGDRRRRRLSGRKLSQLSARSLVSTVSGGSLYMILSRGDCGCYGDVSSLKQTCGPGAIKSYCRACLESVARDGAAGFLGLRVLSFRGASTKRKAGME